MVQGRFIGFEVTERHNIVMIQAPNSDEVQNCSALGIVTHRDNSFETPKNIVSSFRYPPANLPAPLFFNLS